MVSLYKRRGSFTPEELGFYAAEILLGITGPAFRLLGQPVGQNKPIDKNKPI